MLNIEDVQKKKSVTLTGVVGPDPVKGESDKLPKPGLSSKNLKKGKYHFQHEALETQKR